MKVAVYSRHWSTVGGGEKFAGGIAETLSHKNDVHLLSYAPLDRADMGRKLDLDLSRTRVDVIEDLGIGSLAASSADFDVLFNCSYLSPERSGARKGIYLVFFPTPFDHDLSRVRKALIRLGSKMDASGDSQVVLVTGFHLPEGRVGSRYRWTAGDARLQIVVKEGVRQPVSLYLGSSRPKGISPTSLEVFADGTKVGSADIGIEQDAVVRFEVEGKGSHDPIEIRLVSGTFTPKLELGSHDERRLGVRLRRVKVGSGPKAALVSAFPALAYAPPDLSFLETYDLILSISEYTRKWVKRYWNKDSEVLYPPVTLIPPADKQKIILSVGRFFSKAYGHSKKQLEMVKAFRKLVASGLEGWEYHLVGGVQKEQADYLEEVRSEAEGTPVHFHIDASGNELRELYSKASIFWHATGLGENMDKDPHRFEHFGISTVEAMSAGAVPIVIAAAGQVEIVTEGKDGLLFSDLDELVAKTTTVINDESLRKRLSEAAIERAGYFGMTNFSERLLGIVSEVVPAKESSFE